MAEALNNRIKNIIECSICLDIFDDPKQLKCNHHFCKQCLEDIIQFREDGSATITCPLRCADETVLGVEKTVRDLSASYEVKAMLEVFKIEDELAGFEIPKCRNDNNCTRHASMYCCESMLCKSCYVDHKNNSGSLHQHQRDTNLAFNKREDKLKVFCEEHYSDCTHLCIDGKFLCAYCLRRNEDHKHHSKNTIEIDVSLLKQALVNDMNKKENVKKFVKCTKESILHTEMKLDEILRKRKEECVAQYVDFLNEQEEMLKSKFQRICNNHMTQYPSIDAEYYLEKLEKSDVELALHKDEVLDMLCRNKNRALLNIETVSLSDTFDFRSGYPLGDVSITVGEEVSVSNLPISTLKHDMKTGIKKESIRPVSGSISSMSEHVQSSSGGCDETLATDTKISMENASYNVSMQQNAEGHVFTSNTLVPEELPCIDKIESEIPTNPSITSVLAFFDIEIDNKPTGRIIMNMFHDVVPKSCENFVQLCTHHLGFGYKGSKLHSVNRLGGFCEGGDIANGDGSGGKSIYGKNFKCENFVKDHDSKGILSMRNRHLGGFTDSIFFITAIPLPRHDGNHVVIGKVTDESYNVVETIMAVETRRYKPLTEIIIVNCGVM